MGRGKGNKVLEPWVKIKSKRKVTKKEEKQQKKVQETRHQRELVLSHGGYEDNNKEAERVRKRQEKLIRKNRAMGYDEELDDFAPIPVPVDVKKKTRNATSVTTPSDHAVSIPLGTSSQVTGTNNESLRPITGELILLHKSKSADKIPQLDEVFRPDEIHAVTQILEGPLFQNSTLTGVKMDEVTVPFAAVVLGRFDLVRRLIKDRKFHHDEPKKWGTPFSWAIVTQNWEMMKLLLTKDPRVHELDEFGNTPLIRITKEGDWTETMGIKFWKMIQKDPRRDIQTRNKEGITLLHRLTWIGWGELMEEILRVDSGGNEENPEVTDLVNWPRPDGTTPLMIALMRGFTSIAQLLITKKASLVAKDHMGFTPLCHALGILPKGFKMGKPRSEETLTPCVKLVLDSLNDGVVDTNARVYASERLDLLLNPPLRDPNKMSLFCALIRACFAFIVGHLEDGIDILLNLHVFATISQTGQKHMSDKKFVGTLCGILFDTLVAAENFPESYEKMTEAFVQDGTAAFLFDVMTTTVAPANRTTPFISKELNFTSSSPSKSSVSCVNGRSECLGESEGLESQIEFNNGIGALMSFVQLLDAPQLTSWFEKNFYKLKAAYNTCQLMSLSPLAMICDLDEETVLRTKKKVFLFELLIGYEGWTPIEKVASDHLNILNPELENDAIPTGFLEGEEEDTA